MKSSTVGERIDTALSLMGGKSSPKQNIESKAAWLDRKCMLSLGTAMAILDGTFVPGEEELVRIGRAVGVNPEFLRTGDNTLEMLWNTGQKR